MITLYVPDIGDGLAAGILTLEGNRIQIDCGSQQRAEMALEKGLWRINPDTFLLSHFHMDHYNGLLQVNHYRPWYKPSIRQVFYPRIPEFRQRETFLLCMFSMAHRIMGDTSGSMAADFLNVLSQINHNRSSIVPYLWETPSI